MPTKRRPTTNSEGSPLTSSAKDRASFWKWFGKSKITDADGRPLVVYHGTDSLFVKFSAGEFGFHFGNESAADLFGETRKYYLSIQSPLVIRRDMGHWAPEDMISVLPYPEDEDLVEEFLSDRDVVLQETERLRSAFQEDLTQDGDMLRNRQAVYEVSEPARQLYLKYGFDGVVYTNEVEGRGIGGQPNWSYIALLPEQVRRVEFPGLALGEGPARAANGRR